MAMASVGKRKAERRGCQVKAQVLRPDRADPIDCTILDFSATGARVKLNGQAELPSRFKLYIPSRPETKSVILRWMRGLEFGVEYSTGLADERTFFELIERVAVLERGGAGPDGSEALAILARRMDALEARLESAPDARAAADVESGADLRQRIDEVATAAEDQLTRSEQFLMTRLDEAEQRLRALQAPDVAGRLARLEALAETAALASPAPHEDVEAPGPDPRIVARIADLEARLMSAPRGGAFDPSALDAKIEQAARHAEERTERVERFLMARIDDLEAEQISAPAAPAAMRSSEVADIDFRVHELAARFDALAASAAAPSAEREELARLAERVSDLEVSVMELRIDQPTGEAAASDDLARRIAEIEGRHGEIIATLRNLLALLSASEARRAAS
ncbi:MAG TPA: PilZ domain-containing protein [Rhodoblastus sp.]|nr:PilZ domain-containing protein [Rhodoblastus sp.]